MLHLISFGVSSLLRGLDFSSEWRDSFLAAREQMSHNLHILHPSHQTILKICHNKIYSKLLLVDLSDIRYAYMETIQIFSYVY